MKDKSSRNLIQSTTDLAMHIASAYIRPGSTVVDATCGNGHDTLALARAMSTADEAAPGGSCGRLIAFDVQQAAVDSTRALLEQNGFAALEHAGNFGDSGVVLICDSHENMDAYVSEADLILFNLGYLPGGDKSVTTEVSSTLEAVSKAVNIISPGGLVCVTMYSGHETGAKEKAELLDFASQLDSHLYHVAYVSMANQPNNPPEILLISRK